MPTWFVPEWAPNLHPMVVHFPIVWLISAILVDILALALPRTAWAHTTATILYPVGALSALVAYLTGRQAAATVLTPGLAHSVVHQHWNLALATTILFGAIAVVRLLLLLTTRQAPKMVRAALTVVALAGLLLLFYTGELGARLVYEYGLGVRHVG